MSGNKHRKRMIQSLLAALLLLPAGCAGNNTGNNADYNMKLRQHGLHNQVQIQQTQPSPSAGLARIPIQSIHNADYVALSDIAAAAGYNADWLEDGRSYGVGDTGVEWTAAAGSAVATAADQRIQMAAPAVKMNNRLYIPLAGAYQLFGNDLIFASDANGLRLLQRPEMGASNAGGSALPLGDDQSGRTIGIASVSKGVQAVNIAKKYLGIKYRFGAAPYATSRRFDCSSFTQLVMRNFGISLPRTARAQANYGHTVSRSQLRPGDLIFFSVPGRFKSAKTVGHVGIYIGNGQMINANTAPKNGVQIVSLSKPWYRENYLFSKRVLS